MSAARKKTQEISTSTKVDATCGAAARPYLRTGLSPRAAALSPRQRSKTSSAP
jgi:hypothetical protein